MRRTANLTADGYAGAYRSDYGFEASLVSRRHAIALETLRAARANRVLEVGCGLLPLAVVARRAGFLPRRWVIVEPRPDFLDAAAQQLAGWPIELVAGAFEEVVE